MNEAMKKAWLEIDQMLGEPTREELDVFLRTWQRAIQAEREECAKVCEKAIASIWEYSPEDVKQTGTTVCNNLANAIRARGQA
jgi:hypothetical protein